MGGDGAAAAAAALLSPARCVNGVGMNGMLLGMCGAVCSRVSIPA